MTHLPIIDKSWTLFLDRDGVINVEKHEDYIRNWEEFAFYEGVKEALRTFNHLFGHIFIVTNQRGIGRGLMTSQDLESIHNSMLAEIVLGQGRIDQVYYSPDLDNNSPTRKPNPGMGLQAKRDFPGVNFSKSIMIGNTMSDMAFGKNIGAITIFLPTTRTAPTLPHHEVDFLYPSLASVAAALQSATP